MPVSESEMQELIGEMDRWPDDSLVYRLAAALSAVHQQLREAEANAWDEGYNSRWDNAVLVRSIENPHRGLVQK